jgi:hypothetical protein
MSCNIIKELHISAESNTNIGIKNSASWGTVDLNAYSQIPRLSTTTTNPSANTVKTSDAIKAIINNTTPGFSINSEIVKLEE